MPDYDAPWLSRTNTRPSHLTHLWNQSYDRIASTNWLYEYTKNQEHGKSLDPFARGQIFSSAVAEEIELFTDKHATWGQIFDEKKGLSSEIDVIVYREKPIVTWPRAGYSFVKPGSVVATINCKVHLFPNAPSLDEFQETMRNLRYILGHSKPNYIVAEYVNRTRRTWEQWKPNLLKQGWTDVFVLFDGTEGNEERRDDWHRFMKEVSEL